MADSTGESWTTPQAVREQFQNWARPSTGRLQVEATHDVRDLRRVCRLGDGLHRMMQHREKAFRQLAVRRPMLVSYQSDATSFLTMWNRVLPCGSVLDSHLRRSAHDLTELLSERVFLATCSGGQSINKSETILRPPRLLRHGKTSSVHMSAWKDTLMHPFALGSQMAVVVSSYVWDRACFSSCYRMAQQLHQNFWRDHGWILYNPWGEIAKDLDVVVGVGCASHDIATGLRWGTSHMAGADDRKLLFLAVEAVRNGARYLHRALPEFLDDAVVLDDGGMQTGDQVWLKTFGSTSKRVLHDMHVHVDLERCTYP